MIKKNLVLVGAIFIFMFLGCHGLSAREPDCVGSMVMDKDYDLQIVANCPYIEDKVSFAWSLYEKCKENSFRSTMFSYDITGYPRKLVMEVYLWEKDIEKDEPFMEIEFRPSRRKEECNIKDNSEKYTLYINGENMK